MTMVRWRRFYDYDDYTTMMARIILLWQRPLYDTDNDDSDDNKMMMMMVAKKTTKTVHTAKDYYSRSD